MVIEEQRKEILVFLQEKYNKSAIDKKALSWELGCSVSKIDKAMSKGMDLPNYKKLGTAKNSKVIFPLVDVATYLANTIQMI